MQLIKKISYFALSFSFFFIGLLIVSAAPSYSISVSSQTIENGSKVTASVTVKQTAAWNIKITSAGNTSGCSNQWVGDSGTGNNVTKTFSVTCRSTSTGLISFTVSGDITSADGTNISISGSKRVTVNEKAPDSKINALTSIKVGDYELLPAFAEDTLEYTVTVPPTTTKITLDATKKDSKSTLKGTGEFDVNEGSNLFTLEVTAENGDVRTYQVNVNVEDTNPILVTVNNKNYTILKTSRNLEIPSLYTETSIEINGTNIPVFTNDITNLVLIALKDASGNISFFIYDNGNYFPYIELNSNNIILYPMEKELNYKGYNKTTIDFQNTPITAYQYKNDNHFYLIYGLDLETNKENTYMYDSENNTLQIFNAELFNSLNADIEFYLYFLLGSASVIFLCLIIIIALIHSRKKIYKVIQKMNNPESSKVEEVKKIEETKATEKKKKKNKKTKVKDQPEEDSNILEDD